MPVQLRFAARLTSETYVSERGWLLANLDRCPAHSDGGSSFRRQTPHERKWPIGAKIAAEHVEAALPEVAQMEPKYLSAKMPDLDRPTAFILIVRLDRLVAELWLLYGDEIWRSAGHDVRDSGADGTELDLRF